MHALRTLGRLIGPNRGWAWGLALLMWASLGWAAGNANQSGSVGGVSDGGVLPVPALSAHVIDQTGTLDDPARAALDRKLSDFEQRRGTQLVVLIVPTTQPEDIAAYAQRVGDHWKIGRKQVGDGLLLVVAKQDRRVRIEVAKALEGAIPDLAASRIIERVITPAFREGDFAGGLDRGVDQLIARVEGENLPLPEATPAQGTRSAHGHQGLQFNNLLLFGLVGARIVFGMLSGLLGRKGGALLTGLLGGGLVWLATTSVLMALGAWLVVTVLSLAFAYGGRSLGGGGPTLGGGWGGGGWSSGGGSSGGGWSSGGGGDFGGGGASGRW